MFIPDYDAIKHGLLLVSLTGLTYCIIVVSRLMPRMGILLANLINKEALSVHNVLLKDLLNTSIAYYKAHEKDFEAKGILLVDYVFSRVNPIIPNLSKLDVDHAVEGFLQSLAANLNGVS